MEKEEEDEEVSWSCWLKTMLCGYGAMMVFIFNGTTEGQSAVLLPQLKQKDSLIPVTAEEETWIASLGILLSPVSSLLIGTIVDVFGRKLGLLSFHICMGLGFGIIAFATEVWHIYAGRCICGFALGLEVVAVVYLAETCTKKQRSVLLAFISAAFVIGVLLAYVVGGYLPWNIASAILSLMCFLNFLIQLLAPESPAWLYKRGRPDASTRSLQKLGRSPEGIARELEMLRLSSKEQSEKFQLRVFLEPTVWKPFLILSFYHFLQAATGVYHFMYYTLDFIERLGTTYDPLTVSLILSVIRVVINATLGMWITARMSRRLATVISSVGMCASLIGMGVWEHVYRDTPVGARNYEWFPIVLLNLYIIFGIIGVTTLPWLMSGEVFPLRVRGSMSGAVFVVATGSMFVFIKSYDWSIEALGMSGLLFTFAAMSFLGIFLGAFFLPETQNKTLYEIERGFMSKSKRVATEWTVQKPDINEEAQREMASGQG
ncbi:unnamed protein product [Bemisia tabaci]|uniref:Major facilitator superfamily (MFS) profile domain-containing protein n=1 Tax=Bemisia tabaci TaxID=7038 RepID=A0A9P0CAK4_BEMTA|nr:unnamed protein product [Bemisia tabaci]